MAYQMLAFWNCQREEKNVTVYVNFWLWFLISMDDNNKKTEG